ncbi:hypothetical protein GGI05_003407 [Coemansia sp. RSA 2603]|nr:hypothetical protein GGI05_003407 [Coemansia sp. RSA 2603]
MSVSSDNIVAEKPISLHSGSGTLEEKRSEQARPTKWWNVGGSLRYVWNRHRLLCVLCIWVLLTAYFIVSLALKRKTQLSDILPFIFLYVFVTGRIIFAFVSTKTITRPTATVFRAAMRYVVRVPLWVRYAISVSVLLAIVLSVSLSFKESSAGKRIDRMQAFLGVIVITLGLVATSKHPRSIQWHTVIVGFLMQFCLGCIVTKTQWGQALFSWLASIASSLLEFSNYGTKFILGDTVGAMTSIFAISVFPAIIFFASFIQVVYYLGGIQWMLKRIGWVFHKTLDISGCESVVTAASPFIGQSENVLLVKDYLPHMTKSEIHACMTAGFATVSGSTLQGYIALGVNAQNIITACIMSIPCSVALSKIQYPETEESLTRGKMVEPPRSTKEVNVLHAVANGAATGINLSLLIAANLIAIISLVHLVDFLLTWFGQFIAIHELTIELILGYVLYPFTWLLGVPAGDVLRVSQLLGLKFVANEFVAYQRLNDASSGPSVSSQLSVRGRTIAEFAFCGFGNLGSIAMQVGALSTLAPGRSGDFSRLAFSACVTGSIATCLSAAIISMVI